MTAGDSEQVDRSALAEEAGSLRRWLVRYFRRRVRDHADAEDMVQDVFARMVARDRKEAIEHFGGYVIKTAHSVLADHARLRSTHRAALHVAFDSDIHGEEEVDPERVLGGKQELYAVATALLSLPERTRNVFILSRLEGRKYVEIARQLGVSVSAVEKHMIKAIAHLTLESEKRHGS